MRDLFYFVAVVAVGSHVCLADISFVSASRSVFASAGTAVWPSGPGEDYEADSSMALGLYDRSVVAEYDWPGGPPPTFAYHQAGRASLLSNLLPNSISWSGSVGGTDSIDFGGIGHGVGGASLAVTFDVPVASEFYLSGSVTGGYVGLGSPWINPWFSVRLESDVAAPLVFSSWTGLTTWGVLQPGRYTLSTEYENGKTGSSSGTIEQAFSGVFVVPTPSSGVVATCLLGASVVRRRRTVARSTGGTPVPHGPVRTAA